jgi:hypothetical protein
LRLIKLKANQLNEMKIYYCFLCAIFSFYFTLGQRIEKTGVLILSVNFYTETIISVPCVNFATNFKEQLKINAVYAEDSIRKLDSLIKHIKYSNTQKSIDTRAKIVYKDSSGKDFIICLNNFDILINGSMIKKNKTFFNFVRSLVPKEQLIRHKISPS